LKSCLDTHTHEASPTKTRKIVEQTPEKAVHIPGKQSRATKVRDLASDIHGTGDSALSKLERASGVSKVIDLDL
jgi:hypothetical protein